MHVPDPNQTRAATEKRQTVLELLIETRLQERNPEVEVPMRAKKAIGLKLDAPDPKVSSLD